MSIRMPLVLLLLVTLSVAGCRSGATPPASGPGGPDAASAVERFVRLAGNQEFSEMGWVFGTEQGPVLKRDPEGEVEQRMYALAMILQHEDFAITRERRVPGRLGRAIEFNVTLTQEDDSYDVPFTAVQGNDGRWYVEQVDLEVITGRR